jgi:hypothetical protein
VGRGCLLRYRKLFEYSAKHLRFHLFLDLVFEIVMKSEVPGKRSTIVTRSGFY